METGRGPAAGIGFDDVTGHDVTDIIDGGGLDPTSRASITVRDAAPYLLAKGDLLFARSGATVGKTYLYDPSDGPSAHAGYVIKFQIDSSRAMPRYVFWWTQSHFYWHWVAASIRQGAQPNINAQEYGKHQVLVPPLPEQERVVIEVDAVNYRLLREQATLSKLELLKQGLMQDLLTGRVRLLVEKAVAGDCGEKVGNGREANIHFKRSALAAEIVDQMHGDATFGHVKFMKTLYLVEHLAELDLGGHYHRAAAGPLDNRMIRSVDSQMKRQKWFDRVVRGTGPDGKVLGYAYVRMENAGGHRQWFEKYWGGARARIQGVIDLLKPFDSRRCEIVATLYEAWRALVETGCSVSDDAVLDEVLLRWHEKKQEVPRARWAAALGWMKGKGLLPQG